MTLSTSVWSLCRARILLLELAQPLIRARPFDGSASAGVTDDVVGRDGRLMPWGEVAGDSTSTMSSTAANGRWLEADLTGLGLGAEREARMTALPIAA